MFQENFKQFLKLFFDLKILLLLLLFFLLGLFLGRFVWVSDQSRQVVSPPPSPSPITSLEEVKTKEQAEIQEILPVVYVVQPGDSTWRIAEAFYGDGQHYVDIEKANNLTADSFLEVGQELTIPKLETEASTETAEESVLSLPDASPTLELKSTDTVTEPYIVQANDSLWFIALKYLNDGHRWVEIYQQNRPSLGDDPNLIYPGQTLILPTE